ncbi:hypothetical protein RBG61_04465 [Paludicola sp. MB14-C6]|uniref:hypothetical protein n=1 Tax=Paludihabitans sp. MB14-C6 TaxID=3070656 RepID=UPI0027DACD26|nr:hypothetical protein [Paludicola sp. MB14-C6]WMJ23928.1 hypothetical protein RBG61_04465 [Paludicola sp. MB14-C6]
MAEEKKKKDNNLDAILSEINETIRKDAKKVESEEKVETQSATVTEPNENKEAKPPQSTNAKGKNKNKNSVIEATKNTSLGKDLNEDSSKESRSARFIEVTSSEMEGQQEPEIIIEKKTTEHFHDEVSRSKNPQIQKLKSKKSNRSKRQKRVALIGGVMSLFCIIGVIASVWGLIRFTNGVINNTSQKEELAKEIFPFVIIDIPEFDNPTKLDNSAIISSAIWEFIIDEPNKAKYDKDDLGCIYVPAIDIEPYIRRLYGNNVKIKHQTVDDTSVQMNYDEQSKMYSIESTPKFLPYRPRVDKITKSGDILTLKVSYVMPNAMWDFKTKGKVEQVGKTMQYKVKKIKTGYQLLSVKLLSVEGISSSNAASSTKKEQTEETPSEGTTSNGEASQTQKQETSSTKE